MTTPLTQHHGECSRCGAIFASPGLEHCPVCETWLGKSKPVDANTPTYREWLIQEYLYRHQLDARNLNDVERAEKWADEMVGKLNRP